MNALVCLLLLPALTLDEQAIHRGDVKAVLRLDIPDEGAGVGLALVHVDLSVTGPPALEVEGPRLEDALAGWRAAKRSSSWRLEGEQAHIDIRLTLEQVKPGVMPLPGVVLRARAGSDADWEEFSWPELLHDSRDGGGPEITSPIPPSPWPGRLGMLALAMMVALAVAWAVRAVSRRVQRREQPAHVRALARLQSEPITAIDEVVRDYLDERFALNTRRQTAAEVVSAAAMLPEDARPPLAELIQRAELAKFSGVAATDEQRRELMALARQVIERCAAIQPDTNAVT